MVIGRTRPRRNGGSRSGCMKSSGSATVELTLCTENESAGTHYFLSPTKLSQLNAKLSFQMEGSSLKN
jgi:hypothetical protein